MSNQTATQFHTWVPEPLVRGTFSILLSCLFTLLLCVWTAVHLNIPEYKKESEQMWRKMKWLVVALIAPEVIALLAWSERKIANEIGANARCAFSQPDPPKWHQSVVLGAEKTLHGVSRSPAAVSRKLLSIYQTMYAKYRTPWEGAEACRYHDLPKDNNHDEDEDNNSKDVSQRYPWTPTHSFFACMGGFAFDTRDEKANFLPHNRRRIALTGEGVKYLLENVPSLLPNIPETTIQDKSKGSWVTKLITCLQALWFCSQCFARWSQGISVSLLELNTLAHALCAFLIYFFWWNKPLDIDEPVTIHGESMRRVAAFMCLSAWSTEGIRCVDSCRPELVKRHDTRQEYEEEDRLPNHNGTLELLPGQFAYGFKYIRCDSHQHCQRMLKLSHADIRCWQLAREALDSDLVTYRDERSLGLDEGETYKFLRWGNYALVKDCVNTDQSPPFDDRSQDTIGILLASLFYGGIHLIAWNRAFRTTTEAALWKLSGIGIITYGVAFAGFRYFSGGEPPWYRRTIWIVIFWSVVVPGGAFYIFCRTYIIVESFLDLFHLPDSAFQVPTWSQYFPHI